MSKVAKWSQWEMDFADAVFGNQVKASGRTELFKGDVKDEHILVDCKQTSYRTFHLTLDIWESISEWARNEGREPVVAVRTDAIEIDVVSAQFYWEISSKRGEPYEDVEIRKGKMMTPTLISKMPILFHVGCYSLVAIEHEDFVHDYLAYKENL